jgi:hypothetical protein
MIVVLTLRRTAAALTVIVFALIVIASVSPSRPAGRGGQ